MFFLIVAMEKQFEVHGSKQHTLRMTTIVP